MEKLQAAGAVAEDDPDAETTLWAATEGVPKALAAAKSKAGKDDARLVDAMIESMATLTEQRVASGGAEAAANTLKSEAVQDSVADVITDAMAVWLEVDPEDEEEAEAIAEIALRAGANAGKVVAGLSDDALASSSGKELAKASVKRSAVPQDVAATKTALKSGQSTKDLTPEIEDSSEVEEIFTTVVADDPTLMAEVDTDGDGYVGDDDAFPSIRTSTRTPMATGWGITAMPTRRIRSVLRMRPCSELMKIRTASLMCWTRTQRIAS